MKNPFLIVSFCGEGVHINIKSNLIWIHSLFILPYYECIVLLICIYCVDLYKLCMLSKFGRYAGVKKRVGEEIDIDRILIFTTFMLRQPRMF